VEFRSDIVEAGELIASEDRCDGAGRRILDRGIALLTARGDTMEDSCRQAASCRTGCLPLVERMSFFAGIDGDLFLLTSGGAVSVVEPG
jgi:hypothetical protein